MEKENYRMHGQVSQGSSYWTKGHLMGTRGPGGDLQENNQPLVETMYGQICRRICLMQRKRKQNKDGLSRNQNSTMPDNWEEYSILDQTVKNSSSQSKPLGESWKFRCQQQSCSTQTIFGKSCEEQSWNHCASTPHRSETNGIAERAVRRVKEAKLDNARQLRGIFFIEPNDEEFKLTVKAARRKLEVPMPPAMLCKIPKKSTCETHRNIEKRKAKYACVVDADESTRPRLHWAVHKHHQDHITEKGMNSATILFANSFRCLKQWKFWMLRQQWRKEWEKPWENSGMAADESREQERGDRWSKE